MSILLLIFVAVVQKQILDLTYSGSWESSHGFFCEDNAPSFRYVRSGEENRPVPEQSEHLGLDSHGAQETQVAWAGDFVSLNR